MSLGMKVTSSITGKTHDVYAIIRNKDEYQKIYLLKGPSGASRISLLTRVGSYILLDISPDIDPEEKISDDYQWMYESQLTVLHPKNNADATILLRKEF